jgi:K+-sensing histidine kinase KdpD
MGHPTAQLFEGLVSEGLVGAPAPVLNGIPSKKVDEIFDAFYTTKAHGSGLGLSIARTIVDTYGGKIRAENRPEGGAAFHFTIPLSANRLVQVA